MIANPILRTGGALAVTVAAGYAVCTALFLAFPGAATAFMNALFHGLDFTRLQDAGAGFRLTGFGYALLVLVVWAFCIGAFFAWLHGPRRHP